MSDVTVNIIEEPVELTLEQPQDILINITGTDQINVNVTEEPIQVIVTEEPVVITFPDPNTVGPAGQKGDRGEDGLAGDLVLGTLGADILAYSAVYFNLNNKLIKVSADDLSTANRFVGLTLQSGLSDTEVLVQFKGSIENLGWSFIPNQNIYVGIDGAITQVQTGLYSQLLGYAITSTKIFLSPSRAVIRGL